MCHKLSITVLARQADVKEVYFLSFERSELDGK